MASSQTADFPAALHTAVSYTNNANLPLGTASPTHTELEEKQEKEILEIQKKLGIGSSPASSASTGSVLKKQSDGSTKWMLEAVSVKDFGAVGDGTTDDTTAIQNAVDAGSVILFPPGDYVCGHIEITDESKQIIGLGDVRIIQNAVSYNKGVFYFTARWSNITTVNSIAVSNQALQDSGESSSGNTPVSVLTLASAITLKKGDLVKLISDDVNPFVDPSGTSLENRMGEYAIVAKDVTAGTEVVLNKQLVYTYSTNIRIATPNQSFLKVDNIHFDTSSDLQASTETIWTACISILGGRDSQITNCRFTNQLGRGIMNMGYQTLIDSCRFTTLHNRPTKSRYGYGVADNGTNTIMRNCYGENTRHVYATITEPTLVETDNFQFHGPTMHCLIEGCIGNGNQSQSFDTHSICHDIHFKNCLSQNSFLGASSGGYGFVSRGEKVIFENCHVVGGWGGFGISAYSDTELRNCSVRDNTGSVISSGLDSAVNTITTTKTNILIDGCYFDNSKATGAANLITLGSSDSVTNNVLIRNTTFKPYATSSGLVVMNLYTTEVKFENCVIDLTALDASYDCFCLYLRDSNSDIDVDGLDFVCRDVDFLGNRVRLIETQSDGNTSRVRIRRMRAMKDGSNIFNFPPGTSRFTDIKFEYELHYGSSVKSSKYRTQTASSEGTIDVGRIHEKQFTHVLTGSAGAVDMLTPNGFIEGQRLTLINDSNGTITVRNAADTTTIVSLASASKAELLWNGTSWRDIS